MKFPILLPNIFDHPFTYKSHLKLKIGDFVEVPFGKTKVVGVVWDDFQKDISKKWNLDKRFSPKMRNVSRSILIKGWEKAVKRALIN